MDDKHKQGHVSGLQIIPEKVVDRRVRQLWYEGG